MSAVQLKEERYSKLQVHLIYEVLTTPIFWNQTNHFRLKKEWLNMPLCAFRLMMQDNASISYRVAHSLIQFANNAAMINWVYWVE